MYFVSKRIFIQGYLKLVVDVIAKKIYKNFAFHRIFFLEKFYLIITNIGSVQLLNKSIFKQKYIYLDVFTY